MCNYINKIIQKNNIKERKNRIINIFTLYEEIRMEKNKKSIIVITIAAILLIVLIICGGYYFYNKNNTSKVENESSNKEYDSISALKKDANDFTKNDNITGNEVNTNQPSNITNTSNNVQNTNQSTNQTNTTSATNNTITNTNTTESVSKNQKENQDEKTNKESVIGKWKMYEAIDPETGKQVEISNANFGSGYSGESYLILNSDGTFEDYLATITSSEFSTEGTYKVMENYYKQGDCYIVFKYSDGREATIQMVYYSDDGVPSLCIPANGDMSSYGYEFHMKKEK